MTLTILNKIKTNNNKILLMLYDKTPITNGRFSGCPVYKCLAYSNADGEYPIGSAVETTKPYKGWVKIKM